MSHLVVRPLKLDARKCVRWATLILPLFLCGCFENPQKTKQSLQSKEYGISSIGRFFTFYQDASSTKAVETANRPSFSPYLFDTADFSESAGYSIEEAAALPDFVAAGREGFAGAPSSARVSEAAFGRTGREQSASFRNAVSLVFNAPFSRVFSSVFEQSADLEKDEVLDSEKAEEPNPFTEALQKEKSAKTDEVSDRKEAVAQEKTDTDEQKDPSAQDSNSTKAADSNNGAASSVLAGFPSGSFLILGDFDGSGVLQAKSAQRSGDKHFVSADGARAFHLYINPDAVARKSSFYVDDLNLDGNTDILAARQEWLLGAVLLGDGTGGYKTGGSFLTAFDAVLPCAGPIRNGMRQIMTVSPGFGLLRTFHYTDKFRLLQTDYVRFAPEFLLHLVAADSGIDYVMAAQIGGAEQLLGWRTDGFLEAVPDTLGVDATVLRGDLDSYSLQAFQVGNYASIVLTNKGASFNVANMRLTPGTFLVVGDFQRKGTLDVAVAGLESFSPAQ